MLLLDERRQALGSKRERRAEGSFHSDLGASARGTAAPLEDHCQRAGTIIHLVRAVAQGAHRFFHRSRNPDGLSLVVRGIIEEPADRSCARAGDEQQQAEARECSHGVPVFPALVRKSLLAKIATSTRRLACRPASVSLLATGSVSP